MKRKYRVSGKTEEGDVWIFSTDDRTRADDMLAQMRQDLADVELIQQ